MDMNRLKYFCLVAKTGSMAKAAEMLRISPAALSKAMKLLEQETHRKLFLPSGRGIILTDEGRNFAKKLTVALAEMESVLSAQDLPTDLQKTLKIGSFEVFTTYFIGYLLKDHFLDRPMLIHELGPGLLEQAIEENEVDFGITYIPVPHAGLDFMKLGDIEMGIYGKKGLFEKMDFKDIPFALPVAPVSGSPNKVRGTDGWPDDEYPRNGKYRVTLMESALELCRQGLAVSYLPKFVVDLHNETAKEAYQLKKKTLMTRQPSSEHPVYLIKRKSDPESADMKRLAKAFRMLKK
ncbi:MAG: LysR family transcriptional regulator [Methylotenera sp.]|nr:LysR family transcriptional regulator [Oligoflexia bacterium]